MAQPPNRIADSVNWRDWIGRLLIFCAFLAAWWVAAKTKLIDPFFIGAPDAVALYLIRNFSSEVWPAMLSTMAATLVAFLLASVTGVVFGLLLVESPRTKRLLDPFLTAFNSLPRIALAPIFILWFGIEMASKVALAYTLGVFMVLNNTVAGAKNVDPVLLKLGKSLGATPFERFTKIILPWAVPSVFAGLRLALIYSFLGVVTSEMLASKIGLGNLVMYYSGLFRMDAVLGILFVLAICAVALTTIADFVETWLLKDWVDNGA